MSNKSFSFFATKKDLLNVLRKAESGTSFCYADTSDFENQHSVVFQTAMDFPDLGISPHGNQNLDKIYLLVVCGVKPKKRAVEQINGGTRFFLDQLSHPESVMLKPGGVYNDADCIIAGQIGTVTKNLWSVALFKLLFREFKKEFVKVEEYLVGQEALKMGKKGIRLITNYKSASIYDLKI